MLTGFLALGRATDDRILKYAREWGVLGICPCGLPHTHNPPIEGLPFARWDQRSHRYRYIVAEDLPKEEAEKFETWATELNERQITRGGQPCQPQIIAPGTCREPLTAWRELSSATRSAMNIGAAIHSGQLPEPDDWNNLRRFYSARAAIAWNPSDVEDHAWILSAVVNEWIEVAGIRPQFQWAPTGTNIILACPNVYVGTLWTALMSQLIFILNRSGGFSVCSGCGGIFVPKKKPSRGVRRYCEDCRSKKVPERDAARDSRARKKKRGRT